MLHLTINTGHCRRSPREEVRDDIVAMLRPIVAAGGGPIPGPTPGYRVAITREGRDALFTVHDARGAPVLTGGLAVEDAERVWQALTGFARGSGEAMRPTELPWLAVVLHGVGAAPPARICTGSRTSSGASPGRCSKTGPAEGRREEELMNIKERIPRERRNGRHDDGSPGEFLRAARRGLRRGRLWPRRARPPGGARA